MPIAPAVMTDAPAVMTDAPFVVTDEPFVVTDETFGMTDETFVVTDAPYFGRTDAAGSWATPPLPSGRYRVRIWHPLASEPAVVEQVVQVGNDRDVVEIRLTRGLRPAPGARRLARRGPPGGSR